MDVATIAKFWSCVNKMGPMHPVLRTRCWLWAASRMSSGYGKVTVEGKQESANRVSWLLEHGTWPVHLALHCCDVRACVRPDHLFDGTHQDNVADMLAKGRGNRAAGDDHGRAALTSDKVLDIRRDYKNGVGGYKKLARTYGVSSNQILRIVRRLNWRHI